MKKKLTIFVCLLSLWLPLGAADGPAANSDVEQLKRMLLDQQRQIDELRRELNAQKNGVDGPIVHANTGEVASTMSIVPPDPPSPSRAFPQASPALAAPQAASPETSAPLQVKIGDAYITPVGFMDMTAVSRSTNPGTGIGTNFGSIPYGNTQLGSLTETRLSIQNSRIGARVDALVHDMKILGYWESDFLGQLGNPPNGGIAVTSNSYGLRLRLYWVDVTKGKFEFLAGQSWSMMTPNRRGIAPLPSDVFYTHDMDVNYQAGLVWSRVPGFRFVYHPSDKVAFGVALENSEPYVGGGNGGSAITAPTAIAGILGTQVNNGSSVISAAALHPDIIAKLAFDPGSKFHFEITGVEVTNKIANPASTPAFQTDAKAGGGGSINLSFEVAKNIRLLTNNFYSSGAGRYIFGQAPDFMIRADGSLSLVHSASTVTGVEATGGNTLFYGYYGGVYIGRNTALDTNGKLIGYGSLTSDGQNRAIQEVSFGTNTTLARDARWGALSLISQFSYLQRNPWLAASSSPSNAHLWMGFLNLRYTLPGSAPTLGR